MVNDLLKQPLDVRVFPNNITTEHAAKSILKIGTDIYMNTRRGIFKVDERALNSGAVAPLKSVTDPTETRIFCMAQAPDNSIWYATVNNVFKVKDGSTTLQQRFKGVALKSFGFYDGLMIGYTHDNQLYVSNNTSGAIVAMPPQKCIWDELYRLDTGHVIISTNDLYRVLTISGEKRRSYSLAVIDNPFIPLQAETVCADSGNCYFFKDGSVTAVNLKKMLVTAAPPKLFFTTLRTERRTVNIDSAIQLAYRESKNITVSFSALSFGNSNGRYQYSVSRNGEDKWQEVKGEDINIVNPGYGTYVMKIRAKTITSEYCTPVLFSLSVSRPYWAQWWFLMLAFGTCLTASALIIRIRLLQALRRKETRHSDEIKFLKSEYKALNALMNPHFIFNTLNNVQSLINKDEKLAANQYLRIFANLIRQNMHNISRELISLQKEIEVVDHYLKLEKLRFKEKLNYAINIDEHIEPAEIMIPPLLIQPLVENSIKHGILPRRSAEGYISIDITEENGCVVIAVKDNGIGIAAAQQGADSLHESHGLENIRKRIAQLAAIQNKDITLHISDVKDDNGTLLWTIVSVSVSI